jgi:hypothetical protein
VRYTDRPAALHRVPQVLTVARSQCVQLPQWRRQLAYLGCLSLRVLFTWLLQLVSAQLVTIYCAKLLVSTAM